MRRGERKHMASLALCADAQDDTHELEGQNVDGAARLLRAHIASFAAINEATRALVAAWGVLGTGMFAHPGPKRTPKMVTTS